MKHDTHKHAEKKHTVDIEGTSAAASSEADALKDQHNKKTHEHEGTGKHQKPRMAKITEEELEVLRAQVKEAEEAKQTFVRKVADFENSKKRLVKEKEEFAKFANEKIIASFLPVLDNLERALHHGENNVTVDTVISGVELIKKQIVTVLKEYGVSKIEACGKEFDPHFHEAVGVVKTDEHPAGTVVDELQTGYMLKDRLLRPVWVRIAEEVIDGDTVADGESTADEGQKSE